MDTRQREQFRKNLRRGLIDAGFLHYEAMEIVEKLQRLTPDNLRFFPARLFNVNENLPVIAEKRNISRDDAWFLVQKSPEVLFETVGIKTWVQLREERDMQRLGDAPRPAPAKPPLYRAKPEARMIEVEGHTPPPAQEEVRQRRTMLSLPRMKPKPSRRVRKTVPGDAQLALIAKEIHDRTSVWPAPQDGREGLPETSAAWYAIFASLRQRQTTLAKIVHQHDPEIAITPSGRFKTASSSKGKTRKTILSNTEIAQSALAHYAAKGYLPRMSSGKDHLPANSYSWARIIGASKKARGKAFPEILRDYMREHNLPPLKNPYRKGKKASPLPAPDTLIPLIENFRKIENRSPRQNDARKHLPDGIPAWPTLYTRIKKELGMTIAQYYKAYKTTPFEFNRSASLSARQKMFRENLQNGMSAAGITPGMSAHFVDSATQMYDDRRPLNDHNFFDIGRSIRIYARQNGIDAGAAQTRFLSHPTHLFELHDIEPIGKNPQKNTPGSYTDVFASTLQKTLQRHGENMRPDLKERLTQAYNGFSSPKKSPENQLDTLLQFVFEPASTGIKASKGGNSKPPIRLEDIELSVIATYQAMGKRPPTNGGMVEHGPLANQITWTALHAAFVQEGRGLKGCDYKSLSAFGKDVIHRLKQVSAAATPAPAFA